MNTLTMEHVVTDFYDVYKKDRVGGITLVKEYIKQYDLPAIELIIANQREIARNMKIESHVFSPMKSAFYMLVVLGIAANAIKMENNVFIYTVLFVALFIPIWDSHGMGQKYIAHKLFADIIEAEMPYFREYSKEANHQKIEKMLNEQKGTNKDLFS